MFSLRPIVRSKLFWAFMVGVILSVGEAAIFYFDNGNFLITWPAFLLDIFLFVTGPTFMFGFYFADFAIQPLCWLGNPMWCAGLGFDGPGEEIEKVLTLIGLTIANSHLFFFVYLVFHLFTTRSKRIFQT